MRCRGDGMRVLWTSSAFTPVLPTELFLSWRSDWWGKCCRTTRSGGWTANFWSHCRLTSTARGQLCRKRLARSCDASRRGREKDFWNRKLAHQLNCSRRSRTRWERNWRRRRRKLRDPVWRISWRRRSSRRADIDVCPPMLFLYSSHYRLYWIIWNLEKVSFLSFDNKLQLKLSNCASIFPLLLLNLEGWIVQSSTTSTLIIRYFDWSPKIVSIY